MAVTGRGFDNSLDEANWSRLAAGTGGPYTMLASTQFNNNGPALSVNTSSLPRVVVGPGELVCYGVHVTIDANETRDITPPTGGAVRWDLVACRVNWNNNTASIVVVPGGSAQGLPASRQRTPGDQYDVPLALVQVQSGENRIVSWVDYRVWGGKSYRVNDTAALPPDQGAIGYNAATGELLSCSSTSTWTVINAPTRWVLYKPGDQTFSSSTTYGHDNALQVYLPPGLYVFDSLLRGHCSSLFVDFSTRFRGAAGARMWGTMVGTHLTQQPDDSGQDSERGDVNFTHQTVDPIDSEAFNWGAGPARTSVRISGRIDWPGGTAGWQHKKFATGSAAINVLNSSWLTFEKVG